MTQAELKILLNKYTEGTLNAEEQLRLDQWYLHQAKNGKSLADAGIYEKRMRELDSAFPFDEVNPAYTYKLWPRIAAVSAAWKVAAAVAAITLGVWLYIISSTPRHPELVSGSPLANDIGPGKNTAIITLANGKTINLSDVKTGVVIGNELTYNDGSTVANLSPSGRDGVAREGRSSKVQTLTASTPRGGTYQVTLPDGTHVWLNADSKISFPSQFSGKQRRILLSGEAYFEVAKVIRLSPSGRDGRRPERVPFIVESKGQQVEVLGTHFNITAYNDETSTKTTLLEGSVRVVNLSPSASRSSLPRGEMASAREGNTREGSIVLKPNEQSTLARAGKITVKQVDPTDAIAWKNGIFMFDAETLESIMIKVARWYNVEISYQNQEVGKEKFSGSVSRFERVSSVLSKLEKTGPVKFKLEGRKIIVMALN